jgi:hypothetical protein
MRAAGAGGAEMNAPKLTGHRCQCTSCKECFNRERVFERHRIGVHGVNRGCLSVAEMTARGWYRNAAGFWIMDSPDRAAFAQIRRGRADGQLPPLSESDAPDSQDAAGVSWR